MGCASSKSTSTKLLSLEQAQHLETTLAEAKQRRLRELDIFVLDNSLRETAVAAIKGQVAGDKDAILASLVGTGLTDIIGESPYLTVA